jgi:hypothetical protein
VRRLDLFLRHVPREVRRRHELHAVGSVHAERRDVAVRAAHRRRRRLQRDADALSLPLALVRNLKPTPKENDMQRTTTLGTKLIAGVTLLAFGAVACTQQAATTETREVTVETWRAGDGAPELWSSSTVPIDEIEFARKVIVDGTPSTVGLAAIPTNTTFDVPLNNGETATLKKIGDRVELVSFTGPRMTEASTPRGTVKAVELQEDGYALFYDGSSSTKPDILIEVPDLERLGATERAQVVNALALQTLLISLEDVEQTPAHIVMAILVAVVGLAWLWTCYDTAQSCAERCEDYAGWESTCLDLLVVWNGDGLSVGGSGPYSCRCF